MFFLKKQFNTTASGLNDSRSHDGPANSTPTTQRFLLKIMTVDNRNLQKVLNEGVQGQGRLSKCPRRVYRGIREALQATDITKRYFINRLKPHREEFETTTISKDMERYNQKK